MKKIALLIVPVLLAPFLAYADVKVDQAWVRGTVAGQKSTGAFMTLTSDKPVSLVGVSSPAAKMVELHEMKMENNVMSMGAIEKLDLVPGKPTELKSGGYHIMMMELVKPLKAGESVPITLEFKGADGKLSKQEVKAEVRALGSGAAGKK